MNRIVVNLIFVIGCSLSFYGQITVDDTSFTVTELVEDILINSSCAIVENITFYTGTEQGFNGIGFFDANDSGFEIDKGVILSTGKATSAMGPNGSQPLGEGEGFFWLGDSDLESITNTPNLFNATSIQFEFIPSGDFISFDFLFASEEYTGAFSCTFSDVFAFILTDVAGNSVNLAVVPDTNPAVPIKVTTVHSGVDLNNDGDYVDIVGGLSECPPQNSEFFNRNIPPATDAPIDFNGYTQVFTASGKVIPNDRYTIKLVIADSGDGQFDSAVFLAAGSFNIGEDLGEDLTLANGSPGCLGEPILLKATLGIGSTYVWKKDGLPLAPGDGTTILAEGTLEITQSGTYSVDVFISGGCMASDSIIVEFIDAPEVVNPPLNLVSCEDDRDGISVFNLTTNSSLILGNQNADLFSITYHETELEAENYQPEETNSVITNPDAYINISANQTIWVRIAEENQICHKVASFTLNVVRNPVIHVVSDMELCDTVSDGDDENGSVEFDLSTKIGEVLGTQDPADYSVLFYDSQSAADAGISGTELPDTYTNTSNPQTIYVRIESAIDRKCYRTTNFRLIVNPLPVVTSSVVLLQCDDNDDGITLFNLSEANKLISLNSVNENFTYYLTEDAALNQDVSNQIMDITTYANPTMSTSVVYARTESYKGCFRTSKVNLEVSMTQIPVDFNISYILCESDTPDDDPTDGIATFNFSDATNQIVALFPKGEDLRVSYYQNQADALAEQNKIVDFINYRNTSSPFVQNLYVRVENGIENSCLGLGYHITLIAHPLIPVNFTDEYILCLERDGTVITLNPSDVIDTELDETTNTFQWFTGATAISGNEIPNETASVFMPEVSGVYTVLVTNVMTGCVLSATTRVEESYPPDRDSVVAELVSGAFSDNATIVVTVENGIGEYEYRLDNGDWQDSNTFMRVSRGEHTIFVRDIRMCNEIAVDVAFVVDYPKYFTPNGDGIHPTWGIIGNDNVQINKVLIYDRYGKLLKDLGVSGTWDGTYNGNLLPSNEYWFIVHYTELGIAKKLKASFSLIR